MVIIKVKGSTGKIYSVDTINLTCTCPDYLYRKAKTKGFCKHIQKVIESITSEKIDYISIIEKDNDVLNFIDKYGESILDDLIRRGEVIEKNNKLIILK